jgi:adenylate cyclase
MHAMALGASDLVYLGEKERALDWISRALIIDPDDSMNLYNLACALASLDECDQALDLLERHVERMNPERIDWIKRDDALKSLYGRPRWQALIADGEARLAAYHAEQAASPGDSRPD